MNFFYALRHVFKLKWSVFFKILALTLGILASGAFMCRVAYEQSFDNFHPDVENLHIVYMHYNINGKDHGWQRECLAPVAPELKAKIPNVVAATRFAEFPMPKMILEGKDIFRRVAQVDTSFFDVFRLPVLSGDPKKILSHPAGMMVSRQFVKDYFQNGDCIGKEVVWGERIYTIEGIFEDLPNNTHIDGFHILIAGSYREDWDGGDNSYTYVRTKDKVGQQELTKAMNEVLAPRFTGWKTDGVAVDFKAENIREEFAKRVREIDLIMSLLALALILAAGFNFALLAISSLGLRAKEVGVHKASGASFWGIFRLIIWESIIYVFISALLAGMIMWSMKSPFEMVIGDYADVFSFQNMWAVGVVLGMTVLVAGVLPAILFAKIPVKQVFTTMVASRARWKFILLFIQFTTTIFVLSFLGVIVGQYQTMVNHDLGYEYKNLLHVRLEGCTENEYSVISNELGRLSCVEDVMFTSSLIPNAGGGFMIQDMEGGNDLFSCSGITVDSNFCKVHGIEVLSGSGAPSPRMAGDSLNATRVEAVVVNQEFLRRLGKTKEQATEFKMFNEVFTIAGVVKDFQLWSLRAQIAPVMLLWRNPATKSSILIVKLTELTVENRRAVEEALKKAAPSKSFDLRSYSATIRWMYEDDRMFRDGVLIAALILIIISILGVVGYVANEIARRSKEIGVRKVFGSSSLEIIGLIIRNIIRIAILSSLIAIPLAYYVSVLWQGDYALKMPLHWWIFLSAGLFVVITIVICVTIQAWRIANENPANSVKSE